MNDKKKTISQNPLTAKRLVFFAEASPENRQRMERMRNRLHGRGTTEGTLDQVKAKIQELEAVSTDFNLGESIKEKFNQFLSSKGLGNIDSIAALKTHIDTLTQQEHLETLEQVDDAVENVMMRVYMRKQFAEDIKDMPNTAGDAQALKQGLATSFETVITAEFGEQLLSNDRIRNPEGRYYFRVVEARNELRKFRQLGKGPENAKGTEDGIVYFNRATATNRLFNYWYEIEDNVPVMYSIDSETHTLQRWKSNEVGFQVATTYPGGRNVEEVKRIAMRDQFAEARRHMARGLANQIREQSLRLDRNNPFNQHIPNLREQFRRDYQNSVQQRVSREQGGTDFMENISNKISELFDMRGGVVAWLERNFRGLYNTLSRWFNAEPGIRPAGSPSAPTATPEAARTTPEKPQNLPSTNPAEAPERSTELLRQGYQNELPWGDITVAHNAASAQVLTKIKDKPSTVASRNIKEVRLNGRLKNLNVKIDEANHAITLDPDDGTGTKTEQFMPEGNYTLLIENVNAAGEKTYEKFTLQVKERQNPQATEIRLESESILKTGRIEATAAGANVGTLATPRPGWSYRLDTRPGTMPHVREASSQLTNIEISNNQLLFKTPSRGALGITELNPGNHLEVPVELTDGTTIVRQTITIEIQAPPAPTAKDLRLADYSPESDSPDHFSLPIGNLAAGEMLIDLEKDNDAVRWSVKGVPTGRPESEEQDWFEVDSDGKVTLKAGKTLTPGTTTPQQIQLAVEASVPGQTEKVARSLRIDLRPLLTASEATDIAPQKISNNTLPQTLVGATATAGNPVKVLELGSLRNGVGGRNVDSAFIIDGSGNQRSIAIQLDSFTGKVVKLSHTAGGENQLKPGERLRINFDVFDAQATDPTGTKLAPQQALEIQIPNHEGPQESDATIAAGHERYTEIALSPNETITELAAIPQNRAGAVTRSIVGNKGRLSNGQEIDLTLVGNQIKLSSTASELPVNSPLELTINIRLQVGTETRTVERTVELQPLPAPTAAMSQLLVNGSATNTDILYRGQVGGPNRAAEYIGELSPINNDYSRRIVSGSIRLNDTLIDNSKITIDANNRLVLDPTVRISPPPEGVLQFTIQTTAGNMSVSPRVTDQLITIRFRNPEDAREQASTSLEAPGAWRRSVERAENWAGVSNASVMPNGDNQWEIISNGTATSITRNGTGTSARLRIESPSRTGNARRSNVVEFPASQLDRAVYFALLLNKTVTHYMNHLDEFNDEAKSNHVYFVADTWNNDDIECNGHTVFETAISGFKYPNQRENFINLLNGRMRQHREQNPANVTPAIDLMFQRNGVVPVIEQDELSFQINTSNNRTNQHYDYYYSADGESWTPLRVGNTARIAKSALTFTNNRGTVRMLRIPKGSTTANALESTVTLELRPEYRPTRSTATTMRLSHAFNPDFHKVFTLDIGTNASTGRSYQLTESGDNVVLQMIEGGSTTDLANMTKNTSNELVVEGIANALTEANISVRIPSQPSAGRSGQIQIRSTR